MTRLPPAIATLSDEHRYMTVLLRTLDEQIENIDTAGAGDYFLMQDIVRYLHDYPDTVHHPTEDLMFDRLVKRDPGTGNDVARLRRDHDKLSQDTAKILELLDVAADARTPEAADAVRLAVERYSRSLRRHMAIEETDLFPAAVRCLTHADWRSIEARLAANEDPLFGKQVSREYRVLYEYFSDRAARLSQRLAHTGFTHLDSLILSADALEIGASELWGLLRERAGTLVRESRDVAGKVFDGRGPLDIVSLQAGYVGFLGRTAAGVARDTFSVGIRTARKVAAPLFGREP